MASTINGTSTGNGGLISTGDDSGILNIQTNETTAITVDASQNVGIGITSPTRKLQVKGGTIGVTSNDGTVTNVMDYSSIGTATNSAFTLITNALDRLTVDTSGNVLVGLTTSTGSGKTVINATSTNPALCLRTPQATGTIAVQIFFDGDNTDCGSIDVNTTANTTAYTTSSDYRLKENVVSMTGALATVGQLNPVTWNWKHAPEIAGQGFIAHELQAIVPDAVTGDKDAVDADGKPVYQGIDTSFLVATLTAALQETKALIDTQAETINALTARIVAIESRGTV
jgi:hypothetical protein